MARTAYLTKEPRVTFEFLRGSLSVVRSSIAQADDTRVATSRTTSSH